MFFLLHFWGVNNMYWESEGGEFLYPWRKGEPATPSFSLKFYFIHGCSNNEKTVITCLKTYDAHTFYKKAVV